MWPPPTNLIYRTRQHYCTVSLATHLSPCVPYITWADVSYITPLTGRPWCQRWTPEVALIAFRITHRTKLETRLICRHPRLAQSIETFQRGPRDEPEHHNRNRI
ncbi:hypothetical protein HBI56_020870 [Parastagonospora nodorum]|uniref:Uncharacterized protein n=2 Tax=Phaeosphaeria nodorum (strain SN15 / ATCC MYA-4574 / FGSC 10173) TaxID=321614 RepID=A0A7U2F2F6_PHANO|nr:hypothetical protein SNOG_01314 [Parastagonospora nodorum SN15]KAH3908348.1 hypothetical protein HBH56_173840 [Parastagonospora nodorum]EAT90963.1 hypothetical protein SNOG_01314 [Parastagonospora nodorum SN15]KAH3926390.1 hypothetical protein HBH54_169260 [Parastagonospora nodorum]KAH3982121.1 hypothetical protein HBH52_074720 [Parastagonospora nodorum]KAH4007492.1 hypothetical protein HBI10_007860 [Parastagonospora nodorum]